MTETSWFYVGSTTPLWQMLWDLFGQSQPHSHILLTLHQGWQRRNVKLEPFLKIRWMPMFSSICLDSFSMRILSQRCQWLWLDSLGCWCPSARGGQNDFYFQGGGDYWLNWLSLSRLRWRWGRSCGLNWLMRSSDRWWAFSNLIISPRYWKYFCNRCFEEHLKKKLSSN